MSDKNIRYAEEKGEIKKFDDGYYTRMGRNLSSGHANDLARTYKEAGYKVRVAPCSDRRMAQSQWARDVGGCKDIYVKMRDR